MWDRGRRRIDIPEVVEVRKPTGPNIHHKQARLEHMDYWRESKQEQPAEFAGLEAGIQ
jgi:hypothetical protein